MYVESSMKWGKRGLDEEENAKDLEEREKLMKKDKQGLQTFVLLLGYLHFSNGT